MKLFLHIGYHKTGTTYLQEKIFGQLETVNYLGRPWINEQFKSFFTDYKFSHPLDFDPTAMRLRFESIVEEAVQAHQLNPSHPLLISHESLMTGPEWFGGAVVERAQRLAECFPDVKLIISFRNQADFTASNYSNYVMHGGKLSFDNFLHHSFAGQYNLLPRLSFDKVLEFYISKFGQENIHVYLHEELKQTPQLMLEQLCSFLEVEEAVTMTKSTVNKGVGRRSTALIRFLNHFFADDFNEQYYHWTTSTITKNEYLRRRLVKVIRAVNKGRRSSKIMTRSQRTEMLKSFEQSNKSLEKLLNKDLQSLGYFE
ncbi:MAG: sulfotransferase domain-containing protein [Rhodothermaceae bacterium]|nr:sulfotransferase domain-containing protein [Rhodothermaceae bacterium]